ncbi:MAG: hypothetical protein Q8P20_04680 [bacterium]|nr:hypothetical protein [bacterium]
MMKLNLRSILIVIFAIILFGNQFTLSQIADALGEKDILASAIDRLSGQDKDSGVNSTSLGGSGDLAAVNLDEIKSTAQGVAVIMPIDQIKTPEDAIAVMVPTGTPEYGAAMGVSFDEPEGALATLANAQKTLLAGLTPEQKTRFIALASKPVGISCEYCCGVGPIGINKDGSSSCGCQHNPALLSVTMWLMQNTEYSDAEILREVYRWKTLFFPKNMVDLAVKISGGDESVLQDLPGMVGGC